MKCFIYLFGKKQKQILYPWNYVHPRQTSDQFSARYGKIYIENNCGAKANKKGRQKEENKYIANFCTGRLALVGLNMSLSFPADVAFKLVLALYFQLIRCLYRPHILIFPYNSFGILSSSLICTYTECS